MLNKYTLKTEFYEKMSEVEKDIDSFRDHNGRLLELEKKIKLLQGSSGPDLDSLTDNLISKDEFADVLQRVQHLEHGQTSL